MSLAINTALSDDSACLASSFHRISSGVFATSRFGPVSPVYLSDRWVGLRRTQFFCFEYRRAHASRTWLFQLRSDFLECSDDTITLCRCFYCSMNTVFWCKAWWVVGWYVYHSARYYPRWLSGLEYCLTSKSSSHPCFPFPLDSKHSASRASFLDAEYKPLPWYSFASGARAISYSRLTRFFSNRNLCGSRPHNDF